LGADDAFLYVGLNNCWATAIFTNTRDCEEEYIPLFYNAFQTQYYDCDPHA